MSDDLTREANRTLSELQQGREELRERVPREVHEMYAGRYAGLARAVEKLVADVDAGIVSEADAGRRLRRLRRRAAQLEAASVTSSMGFGPMGPLIRLITVVRDRLHRRRR